MSRARCAALALRGIGRARLVYHALRLRPYPLRRSPQDIAWGYYCLANVSVTCRWYLVTRYPMQVTGSWMHEASNKSMRHIVAGVARVVLA